MAYSAGICCAYCLFSSCDPLPIGHIPPAFVNFISLGSVGPVQAVTEDQRALFIRDPSALFSGDPLDLDPRRGVDPTLTSLVLRPHWSRLGPYRDAPHILSAGLTGSVQTPRCHGFTAQKWKTTVLRQPPPRSFIGK